MQSCKNFPLGLVGESGPMRRVRALVARVAATDASVLVVGESSPGKEVVAQALHAGSSRAKREFRAINCGAIPATLIESELFGFERGSFTGATRTHDGIVGQAHGGTHELATDVRIVAATNRKPASAVRDNRLREDLYYRLAAFPVELPPLRDRGDDVVELAEHFLARLNDAAGTALGFSADLPARVSEPKDVGDILCVRIGSRLSDVERWLPEATLQRFAGNKRRAAGVLGCSVKTLYNKLGRYAQPAGET